MTRSGTVLSSWLHQPVPGDHVPSFARNGKTNGGLFALFYVLWAVLLIWSTVDFEVDKKWCIRRRRRYNFFFQCNSHWNIRATLRGHSMVSSLQGLRFFGTGPALNNNICSSSINIFFSINYFFCYSIKIIIYFLSCATWYEEDS